MKRVGISAFYLFIISFFIFPQDIIQTLGPTGELPVNYRAVGFGNADKVEISSKSLKAAILMHTTSDFTNAVIAGAKERFELLNVEVTYISSAEFDPEKQSMDIEKAIELNVDIIITLIIDPVRGGTTLKKAINRGVKIALLSNLPQGFVHNIDYASIVTDDLFNMGKSLAELTGEEMGGKGKLAYIYHDADYYVTNQRDSSFISNITKLYPDIEIVDRHGVTNPSNSKDLMNNILNKNPDINAVYAPWATIAEGVLGAIEESEREDIKVFTMDLGREVSLNMAKGREVKAIVADLPYTIGYTLASVGSLSAIGKTTPPFIIVPAVKVTRKNLDQMWERAYRTEIPIEVREALRN